MTPETKVKTKLKKYFQMYFLHDWWTPISDRFHSGIPDFIACKDGKFVGYECKSKTGKMTDIQKHIAKQILAAGGEYFVVRLTDAGDLSFTKLRGEEIL